MLNLVVSFVFGVTMTSVIMFFDAKTLDLKDRAKSKFLRTIILVPLSAAWVLLTPTDSKYVYALAAGVVVGFIALALIATATLPKESKVTSRP